jgi:hypothetical protein
MGQQDASHGSIPARIAFVSQPGAIRAEIFALPSWASLASRGNLNFRVFPFWARRRIVVKKDAPLADPDVAVH